MYGTRAAPSESTASRERAESSESTVSDERAEAVESTVTAERAASSESTEEIERAAMRTVHVYHAWLRGDAWPEIVTEHLDALASFDGPMIVGMVGDTDARMQLRAMFKHAGRAAQFIAIPGEWERGTLELARAWAHEHPEDAIAYAHTKGASQPTEFNARWRASMAHHVIEGWRHCRSILREGYDAVGCHWLHPDEFGEATMGPTPFFGGNYWLATCAYLNTLPPVPDEDRWGSERWIGMGNPKVRDLAPGWPGDGVFAQVGAT